MQKTPFIFKAILTVPIFISLAGIAFVSWLHANKAADEKLLGIATLFTAEGVMLVTAACLLVFLFKKQERAGLKYFAIIDAGIFMLAGFTGVQHFF